MDTLTGKPKLLKQANLSLIRRAIKKNGTATRAEISESTMISTTTVRSLLAEMIRSGELESVGYDESSGGRKAERYRLKADCYYGVAFCITNHQIHGLVANANGEILETAELSAPGDDFEQAMISYLDEQVMKREIKSIGIGVPGPVSGGGFWGEDEQNGELYRINLGEHLAARYHLPIILENDLNATAIGFGRCYRKEFPGETANNTDMVYLYFEQGCVSAGFISAGRPIRGYNNFAGELGMIPVEDGKTISQWMSEPSDDVHYSDRVSQIICWICGILNPRYVVLGGPGLRKECIGPVSDTVFALLPKHLSTEILYSPDTWHDYHDGMAYLTAGKMFDEVQFIKE